MRGAGSQYGRRAQRAGAEAIAEALAAGEPVRLLLHARAGLTPESERLLARARAAGIATRAVGRRELLRLGVGRPPPELLALVGPEPSASLPELLAHGGAVWLLAGTAYPGNAGFVIRTAEVSGAAGVVVDARFDRSARRDAARAAMRADRLLPVLYADAVEAVEAARRAGHRIVALEDVGTRPPWGVDLRGPVLFVVGGEERGVPAALLERADAVVRVPMAGFMPSYNLQAAMAAVVAERLRQEALA